MSYLGRIPFPASRERVNHTKLRTDYSSSLHSSRWEKRTKVGGEDGLLYNQQTNGRNNYIWPAWSSTWENIYNSASHLYPRVETVVDFARTLQKSFAWRAYHFSRDRGFKRWQKLQAIVFLCAWWFVQSSSAAVRLSLIHKWQGKVSQEQQTMFILIFLQSRSKVWTG